MTLELLERQVNYSTSIEDLFTVVSMPEFLAEGQAIENLLNPDRIVIGTPNTENGDNAFKLLEGLFNPNCKVISTQNSSSELGKLMANAMLA